MALLFMDGFGGQDTAFKWSFGSNAYTMFSSSPRTPGGYYGRLVNNGEGFIKTFAASAQVFVGFGLNSTSSVSLSFYGDSNVTQHITVMRNVSGLIEIRRGSSSGTLLATGTTTLFSGLWNYIEVSCTISDTIGEVHVRLNGSPTDEVSYTGDTKNAGTATTIDAVRLININNATSYFSDLYLLNSTGSAPNNNFLGDVVVRTLSPSGNGTYSQLTGSDGNQTDNYLLVDERPYSGTDYVGSATIGQKDTYAMTDLAAGVTTVYGVQLNGLMTKSDASFAQARYVLRSGGADYGGTTRTLTTSFVGYYELYEQDPSTSTQWTPAGVNSMESGMEVM